MKLLIPAIFALLFTQTAGGFQQPTAASGDWPWWRGPSHNGIAEAGQTIPIKWSDTENVVWKVAVPGRGHSSPTVVGNRVFLATANEQEQIQGVLAFDQMLISGCGLVSAFDPKTGRELWSVEGTTMATCGSMVWDGDLVFASGGYPKSESIAVKADGSRAIAWKNKQNCYEQSMLAYDGYLYGITDQGIAFCWRAADGEEMWKQRVKSPVSASPILIGDTIMQSVEDGTTYVFKADPSAFQLVAENRLGEEAFATPAVAGNRLYVRVASRSSGARQEYLYCIGE